ncbi:MAG: aldo/keto reductase [Burkholderiales bacterium]
MENRVLGKSGIEVSALGLGCWQIGGPFYRWDGAMTGFEWADDDESIRALHAAFDHGITLFDTSSLYGCGHSERILGKALKDRRSKVVYATKFSNIFDEETKIWTGSSVEPDFIRQSCEDSLRRLDTDYIDLFQCHEWYVPLEKAGEVFETLDELKKEGKIRAYGWSTDHPDLIDFFAKNTNGAAIQHQYNVFINADGILKVCDEYGLASINRTPLGMGVLSGKYTPGSEAVSKDDIRGYNIDWNFYFKDGKANPELLEKLGAIREMLAVGGRSLVQGALGWLWAKSGRTIPIPGFRDTKQVTELAAAMEFGPLTAEQVAAIDYAIDKIKLA